MDDPTKVISTVGTRPASGVCTLAADLLQRVIDFVEAWWDARFRVIDVECHLRTAYYTHLSKEPGKVYLHDLEFQLKLRNVEEYAAVAAGTADMWHEMTWQIGVTNNEQFCLLYAATTEVHLPYTRHTQEWPTSNHFARRPNAEPVAGDVV